MAIDVTEDPIKARWATVIRETGEVSAIQNRTDDEEPFLDKVQQRYFAVERVDETVQVGMRATARGFAWPADSRNAQGRASP